MMKVTTECWRLGLTSESHAFENLRYTFTHSTLWNILDGVLLYKCVIRICQYAGFRL